jgi:transposase
MNGIRTRGKKGTPPRDPADPPRRRATKRKGHGTSANDRPPISSIISRETGAQRFWGGDHADRRTCHERILANLPAGNTRLDTDEWQSYRGSHPAHATVRHGAHAWARDDDGDGRREVHCNSGEGAGAALRTSRRAFRGVHKLYLHLDVATYEAMVNAKRVTPKLIRRMCIISPTMHAGYT